MGQVPEGILFGNITGEIHARMRTWGRMVTAGGVVGEAEDGSGTDEFPDPVDVLRPSSDVAVYAPALTREFQTLGGEAIDKAAARLTALHLDAMGQLVQEAATYRDGRSSRKTTDIQKSGDGSIKGASRSRRSFEWASSRRLN